MKVKRIMSTGPVFCNPEDTLTKAALLMFQRDCGAIPVVDQENRVMGIVTDRDISVATASRGLKPADIKASELCDKPVITCSPDDDLEDAVKKMTRKQVRRLPVVDDEGRLAGMLTLADLVIAAGGKKKAVSAKKVFKLVEAVSRKSPIVLLVAEDEAAAQNEE